MIQKIITGNMTAD